MRIVGLYLGKLFDTTRDFDKDKNTKESEAFFVTIAIDCDRRLAAIDCSLRNVSSIVQYLFTLEADRSRFLFLADIVQTDLILYLHV